MIEQNTPDFENLQSEEQNTPEEISPEIAEEITEDVSPSEPKQKKSSKKKALIISSIVVIAAVIIGLTTVFIIKNIRYSKAFELISHGEYEEAYEIFKSLGKFKDSQEQLNNFVYIPISINAKIGDDTYSSAFEYDENANITQEMHDRGNGNLVTEYTYNSDGNLTKSIFTYYMLDNTYRGKTIVKYTYEKGLLIKEETFYAKKGQEMSPYLEGYIEYTYDDSGNIIKEYSKNYGENYTREYTYDKNGNIIKEVTFNHETEKTLTYEYTYDDNGNQIKSITTSYEGDVSIYEYAYDSRGNMIKEVSATKDGQLASYEYIYNKSNKLITIIYTDFILGETTTYHYTYDKYGNPLTGAYINAYDWILEYEYDEENRVNKIMCSDMIFDLAYDEYGNLTKISQSRINSGYKSEHKIKYELIYLPEGVTEKREEIMEYTAKESVLEDVFYRSGYFEAIAVLKTIFGVPEE